jgi:hypothetical protein
VPTEPITRRDAQGAGNTVAIRFLELGSNESDTLNLLPEYAGYERVVQVDNGDPTSLIAQQVNDFLSIGKRTCDRYKKYVPAGECYNVATREENKNTLYLIPDIESQANRQSYEVTEEGGHGLPEEHIQEP